jgi:hypothetical protein
MTTPKDDAAATADQELTEIAAEQGKLADLTLKLAGPPADNPEDDPEKLPDVRQEGPPGDIAPPPGEPRAAVEKDSDG